jgi:hypothetical protein
MSRPTVRRAPVPEQPPLHRRRRARTPEPRLRALTADEWARLGFTRDGEPITLSQVAAHLPVCVLCGGRPDLIGCFMPHPSRVPAFLAVTEPRWGPVRAGKERVAFYALCQACADAPTTLAAVEARLLGEPGAPP